MRIRSISLCFTLDLISFMPRSYSCYTQVHYWRLFVSQFSQMLSKFIKSSLSTHLTSSIGFRRILQQKRSSDYHKKSQSTLNFQLNKRAEFARYLNELSSIQRITSPVRFIEALTTSRILHVYKCCNARRNCFEFCLRIPSTIFAVLDNAPLLMRRSFLCVKNG